MVDVDAFFIKVSKFMKRAEPMLKSFEEAPKGYTESGGYPGTGLEPDPDLPEGARLMPFVVKDNRVYHIMPIPEKTEDDLDAPQPSTDELK